MVVRRIQEDFMAEVIGVRFKEVGKIYYFDPLDNKLSVGDMVIVETARGLECGEVAMENTTSWSTSSSRLSVSRPRRISESKPKTS